MPGPARIHDSLVIERPCGEVFDYVTTPSNWPRWYPITRRVVMVQGEEGEPARAGFECREHIRILGVPFTFEWRFSYVQPPSFATYLGRARWLGGFASIQYFLEPAGEDGRATRFERRLEYVQTNPLAQLLDLLVVRRLFRRASRQGLLRMKQALDA